MTTTTISEEVRPTGQRMRVLGMEQEILDNLTSSASAETQALVTFLVTLGLSSRYYHHDTSGAYTSAYAGAGLMPHRLLLNTSVMN